MRLTLKEQSECGMFCLGWQKWHGMLCPGWQKQHGMLCPGWQKQHGMFCPGWQISGMFCSGCQKMARDVLSRSQTLYQKTRTRYFIYQLTHCFTLQTSDYDVIFDFCVDLASLGRHSKKPGRIAQSVTCLATDACLTADQGVGSSIPVRPHTFVKIDHEMILLLPLIHSRRVVVSYKRKYVHELLVNRLFKPAQEKVWLGELTVPQWP